MMNKLLSTVLTCLCTLSIPGQTKSSSGKPATDTANIIVNAVLTKELKLCIGETTNSIIKLTFVPPSLEDLKLVGELGTAAVGPLRTHMDDRSDFMELLVVRHLTYLSEQGVQVQAALESGLSTDKWSPVRLASMEALAKIPGIHFEKTLVKLLNDPDPLISARANAEYIDHEMPVK